VGDVGDDDDAVGEPEGDGDDDDGEDPPPPPPSGDGDGCGGKPEGDVSFFQGFFHNKRGIIIRARPNIIEAITIPVLVFDHGCETFSSVISVVIAIYLYNVYF
jgi:hypothetical protein